MPRGFGGARRPYYVLWSVIAAGMQQLHFPVFHDAGGVVGLQLLVALDQLSMPLAVTVAPAAAGGDLVADALEQQLDFLLRIGFLHGTVAQVDEDLHEAGCVVLLDVGDGEGVDVNGTFHFILSFAAPGDDSVQGADVGFDVDVLTGRTVEAVQDDEVR
jgi:hypothetical protein